MPELPEVEIVRRGLEPVLTGASIAAAETRRADLRFPFPERFAERLQGQRIVSVARRAKYLLLSLSGGEVLVIHLGMTGRLTVHEPCRDKPAVSFVEYVYPTGADPKHDHVLITLEGGTTLTYNDPRRFGFMLLIHSAELGRHPLFAHLGLEPLGNTFDAPRLADKAAGKKTDLKAFLMDQRVVAGLGNIYVSEALHRAHLSPRRRAATIAGKSPANRERAERLAAAIRAVLTRAIDAGGSTLRDYRQADGSSGGFQHEFLAYGRDGEPCKTPGCGGTVLRLVQGQRATFYCPKCQR